MRRKVLEFIVTGFCIGKIKWAPGTFGTLLGIPLAILLNFGNIYFYMGATLALILFAIFLCHFYQLATHEHDQPSIVIDEVVGYLVTMTWLPHHWLPYALGFVLFRFFDILKPFPINILDQKIKGGLGVVADDLAAGLLSNILLQLIFSKSQLVQEWML
ncbi:MAG: phosphatidylglycerophosphatase A [Pseudomonadota bacterium]|nr:phosphatidylglycerophosphatase A [Pseudomonadota bacterium]